MSTIDPATISVVDGLEILTTEEMKMTTLETVKRVYGAFIYNYDYYAPSELIEVMKEHQIILTLVASEIKIRQSRWYEVLLDVFKDENGELFGITYESGLTEMQEDHSPNVQFVNVQEKTVVTYEPVP